MELEFFATPSDLRAWFEANHDKATEQWVGYYKKDSGKPSITWPESVDQALCFGWIDGVRKSIDAESYKIRFTPRKSTSIWSAVNIKRVPELAEMGLMHPNGLKAFEARKEDKSAIYSHEQKGDIQLDDESEQKLKANAAAWTFLQAQTNSYKKAVFWWVMRSKSDATKQKRIATLIEDSANKRTVPQFTPRIASYKKGNKDDN